MSSEQSFASLMEQVRDGDQQAAAELLERYEPAIRRAIRLRLTDARMRAVLDTMDICQSVMASFFMRAALGQYDLETPEQLRNLLVAMARNKLGMQVRREVLGDAHVDAAVSRTTEFTAEFQDLLTRYAWGEIWSRPGLPRNTRSLVTIAMLIALGRDDELELHLRASEAAGVSRDELRELLLQSAIYCGVPAANHAFKEAADVLAEIGKA